MAGAWPEMALKLLSVGVTLAAVREELVGVVGSAQLESEMREE